MTPHHKPAFAVPGESPFFFAPRRACQGRKALGKETRRFCQGEIPLGAEIKQDEAKATSKDGLPGMVLPKARSKHRTRTQDRASQIASALSAITNASSHLATRRHL